MSTSNQKVFFAINFVETIVKTRLGFVRETKKTHTDFVLCKTFVFNKNIAPLRKN